MTEHHFEINGSSYRVKVKEARAGHAIVEVNGTEYRVEIKTPASPPVQSASAGTSLPTAPRIESARPAVAMEAGVVRAPMPGVILQLMRKSSDQVGADEPVLVLAAMKMEQKNIQWEHSYVAGDKTFCIYIADNESLLQEHSQRSGFPITKIIEVLRIIDPVTAENSKTA